MVKKVAICGTHQDTLNQAPFADEEWEIWGPAHRRNDARFKRMDVGFEIHVTKHIWDFLGEKDGQEYFHWLQEPDIPVYVRPDMLEGCKGCQAYPLEKATKLMGRTYFASTFSFMLCKAILDGVEEIGLYGINLTADEEYFYQRPNAEYLIGLAQGKGIKITIPKDSALLKLGYIYGDGTPVGVENPLIAQLQEREERYSNRIKELTDNYNKVILEIEDTRDKITEDFKKEVNQMLGAQHEMIECIKALKNNDRGGLKDQ